VNLKGGYEGGDIHCCGCEDEFGNFLGYMLNSNRWDCDDDCEAVHGSCADGVWIC